MMVIPHWNETNLKKYFGSNESSRMLKESPGDQITQQNQDKPDMACGEGPELNQKRQGKIMHRWDKDRSIHRQDIKGCPCFRNTLCHHHHGHNSSSKHLCICKRCTDKTGETFRYFSNLLLSLYINVKEIVLRCGYVTSNARPLNFRQRCSCNVNVASKNEDRTGNDLHDLCTFFYYDEKNHKAIILRPDTKFGIVLRSYYSVLLTYLLICLSLVTLESLKLRLRKMNKTKVHKRNEITTLSFILVLLSSVKIIKIDLSRHKRNQTYDKKLAKDVKYKIIDLLYILKNDEKKYAKKILYDIINYCSPSRNENISIYPVSRHLNEAMSAELLRVGSLRTYPDENVPSLIRLAESGFYYEGNEKEVVCFSCGIKHRGWSYSSVPMEVHHSISPECPYLKDRFQAHTASSISFQGKHDTVISPEVQTPNNLPNIETDNVHTCSDSNEGSTPTLLVSSSPNPLAINSFDSGYGSSYGSSRSALSRNSHQRSFLTSSSSGYSSGFISNQLSSGTGSREQQQQLPVLVEGREDNLISNVDTSVRDNQIYTDNRNNTPKEKYPEYALKERRIETYRNWPSNLTFLHPLDLSECGFFYSNFGDCVRCYHCGIGLRNWEADDNPWVEHARWSRKCPYMLQKKGQQFIDSVLTALGLQTDSEVEQQTSNGNSVLPSQSSGYGTASSSANDVRDPIQHPAAVYVIKEKIFGDKKERLVKMTMNQLLQDHDWDNITTDMLINTIIDKHSNEFNDTDQNKERSKGQSESKCPESAASSNDSNTESGSVNNRDIKTSNHDEDPEKMQKENEELKDLYTCKICLDERVGITFVPCGHLVTCKNCSPQLRRCPLCRTFIRGTIKTTI